jgi:hypothetical protein
MFRANDHGKMSFLPVIMRKQNSIIKVWVAERLGRIKTKLATAIPLFTA